MRLRLKPPLGGSEIPEGEVAATNRTTARISSTLSLLPGLLGSTLSFPYCSIAQRPILRNSA